MSADDPLTLDLVLSFGCSNPRRNLGEGSFSKRVLKRDKHRCQMCRRSPGDSKVVMTAHHICLRSNAVGHPLLHDTRNGLALCKKCHKHLHKGLLDAETTARWIKGADDLVSLKLGASGSGQPRALTEKEKVCKSAGSKKRKPVRSKKREEVADVMDALRRFKQREEGARVMAMLRRTMRARKLYGGPLSKVNALPIYEGVEMSQSLYYEILRGTVSYAAVPARWRKSGFVKVRPDGTCVFAAFTAGSVDNADG